MSVVVNTLKLRPGRSRQAFLTGSYHEDSHWPLWGTFFMDTPKISHSHETHRHCHIWHMNTLPLQWLWHGNGRSLFFVRADHKFERVAHRRNFAFTASQARCAAAITSVTSWSFWISNLPRVTCAFTGYVAPLSSVKARKVIAIHMRSGIVRCSVEHTASRNDSSR